MTNHFFDDESLTPIEEIALEAAVAERKALAGQISNPAERMAAFTAITFHEHRLRRQLQNNRGRKRECLILK